MSDVQLIESRVDYLTASMMIHKAPGADSIERTIQVADDLLNAERGKGNDLRRWRFSGFDGLTSGQVSVGRSGQGMLFRLSGDAARDNWRAVAQVATNVSRIDVAGTIRLDGEWEDLSRTHHDEALKFQREHESRLRVTRIDGGKHGRSLMVGSRSSDSYGRIYDKWAESKREEYRDCWRYEVEFKRAKAVQVAQLLSDDEVPPPDASAVASHWFSRRGIAPRGLLIGSPIAWASLEPSDAAKRLGWLRTGVRGSVAWLIEHGYRAEVISALGL